MRGRIVVVDLGCMVSLFVFLVSCSLQVAFRFVAGVADMSLRPFLYNFFFFLDASRDNSLSAEVPSSSYIHTVVCIGARQRFIVVVIKP